MDAAILHQIILETSGSGAGWLSGKRAGLAIDVVMSSNAAGGSSLRNVDKSVCPILPVSFGGDTKSHLSLLFGVSLCQGK